MSRPLKQERVYKALCVIDRVVIDRIGGGVITLPNFLEGKGVRLTRVVLDPDGASVPYSLYAKPFDEVWKLLTELSAEAIAAAYRLE